MGERNMSVRWVKWQFLEMILCLKIRSKYTEYNEESMGVVRYNRGEPSREPVVYIHICHFPNYAFVYLDDSFTCSIPKSDTQVGCTWPSGSVWHDMSDITESVIFTTIRKKWKILDNGSKSMTIMSRVMVDHEWSRGAYRGVGRTKNKCNSSA